MPEHGADGVELLDGVVLVKTVLDIGPDQRSRGFRPKAHALSLAVRKGVHLLGDNVRLLADAPAEELGHFEEGDHHFLEAESAKNLSRLFLHSLPGSCLGRQDVLESFDA